MIIGAGSGMGRSYAMEFARRGAVLALNDFDAASLARTEEMLPSGTTALCRAFDVSDPEAVRGFADEVRSELGRRTWSSTTPASPARGRRCGRP